MSRITVVTGSDILSRQHDASVSLDLDVVKATLNTFVIVKLTEGTNYVMGAL